MFTSGTGEATVRELPSLKTLFALRPHDDVDGPSAEVSPDGKWLLSWGADRRLDFAANFGQFVELRVDGPGQGDLANDVALDQIRQARCQQARTHSVEVIE